jgi:death-on-curing protein
MDIQFLDLDDVLMIHADQIDRYGGSAALRDQGLLESAIAMPNASFFGQRVHADLFVIAAAYLYHIVMNHPFVDGNKRTGTVCALAFLEINGIEVTSDNPTLAEFVLQVAQSRKNKEQIATFLQTHSKPIT